MAVRIDVHPDLQQVLEKSRQHSTLSREQVTPEILIGFILKSTDLTVSEFLLMHGVGLEEFEVRESPVPAAKLQGWDNFSPQALVVEQNALVECAGGTVRIVHFLMGILKTECPLAEKLERLYGLRWSEHLRKELVEFQQIVDSTRLSPDASDSWVN